MVSSATSENTLTMRNIQQDNDGSYVCSASSKDGTLQSSTKVDARGSYIMSALLINIRKKGVVS